MKLKLLFLTVLLSTLSFAQTKGTISGLITDKDANNAALPFANAVIKGTSNGVTSDETGKYSLSVAPGTYTLEFSFVGYESVEVNVTVTAGETTKVNKALGSGSYKLEDVVIKKAVTNREKETAILLDQKKAVEIKQSIGAQEMSRKGVSDVEEGLTKISGITKVGSRGIFVRGLEDRYNSLLVNDLAVPSNSPFKKIIPLDLFPTDIVSVIDVYKTFNPNIYGDFAGGTFNITTSKGNQSITKLNVGVGYTTDNNLANFNIDADADTTKGFLGLAGKDRELPGIFGTIPTNQTLSSSESLKSFKNGFDVNTTKSPLNSSIGLLHSEKFSFKNNAKFSYLLSLNFDNSYSIRKGAERTIQGSDTQIIYNNNFQSSEYKYKTNTSALVGLNYKSDRFELSSNTFYLRNTENSIKDQLGVQGNQVNNPNYLIRTNQLDQSDYLTSQLLGKYFITKDKNQSIKGGVSYSKTIFSQPDRKFFGGTLQDNGDILTSYTGNNFLRQYLDINGNFYFSGLGEYNLKFGQKEKKNEVTVGFNAYSTETESSYRFVSTVSANYPSFITNLNTIDQTINTDLAAGNFNFRESSNAQFKVKLFEYTSAGFANLLLHFGEKWEVNGGIRFEKNYKETKYRQNGSFDQQFKKQKLDNTYFLPSLNIKYAMNDKTNLRFAAGKTYTRPVIMESFPIEYINADGTATRGGDVVNSDNYNVDFKYEVFPTNKEILAIGVFGKRIENPIERTFEANAATGLITTYKNSDEATLVGAEVELIYDFARISKNLSDFSLGFNTSLMHTNVKSSNTLETHQDRELQGASKWIVNSDLKYQFNLNKEWSNTISVVYSVFGKRIFSVGTKPYDHIYELPVSKLDFVWTSKLSQHFDLKFSADNILNPKVKFELGDDSTSTFAENSKTLSDYKRGIGFSLNLGYTF